MPAGVDRHTAGFHGSESRLAGLARAGQLFAGVLALGLVPKHACLRAGSYTRLRRPLHTAGSETADDALSVNCPPIELHGS